MDLETETFRMLRRQPDRIMFDELAALIPGVWEPDGKKLSRLAIDKLDSLGWTEEEFMDALLKL